MVFSVSDRRVDAPGQSGEARIFLIQDDNLTAEVPLRRSILQSTLRQKYRSTGRHNPQRDGGPEKGLYRLHPIALQVALRCDPELPQSRAEILSLEVRLIGSTVGQLGLDG